MSASIDVVIPTYRRASALAATLATLASQRFRAFRVIVSDQTDEDDGVLAHAEVRAVARYLRERCHGAAFLRHLPRRGVAEHRHFLLDQVRATRMLALDDDILLEPDALGTLMAVMDDERCGFVGAAPIGLSYEDDVRPHEQWLEPWERRVGPEQVVPGSAAWQRHKLHNGANMLHVQRRLGASLSAPLRYRVAWVGGCVLYDVDKLRACGGFGFWPRLPAEHCGEDVVAQLRVMARFGGCAILPSVAYHQELPTTLSVRSVNAPEVLDWEGAP